MLSQTVLAQFGNWKWNPDTVSSIWLDTYCMLHIKGFIYPPPSHDTVPGCDLSTSVNRLLSSSYALSLCWSTALGLSGGQRGLRCSVGISLSAISTVCNRCHLLYCQSRQTSDWMVASEDWHRVKISLCPLTFFQRPTAATSNSRATLEYEDHALA